MARSGEYTEGTYQQARDQYDELDVDTEAALSRLAGIPISIHCWQGDDVGGFENDLGLEGSGVQATGNYPGRARTPDQLRMDFEAAHQLIPGTHRINLHAIYAETNGRVVDRDELGPEHFARWIDWAKDLGFGIDFNPTFFSHSKAADGFTLASADDGIRRFWVDHGKACRQIANHMGKELGTPCVNNYWIPDGYKDLPADRKSPRQRLKASLDDIFSKDYDPAHVLDTVESKLFGIGTEAYVVGSYEFYLGYALTTDTLLCVDTGHFHPTEQIPDKISALFTYLDQAMFHVSRGVRWDSDHVVLLSDEVRELALEWVRGGYLDRIHIGLDFFDASINRVAAWVIGTRNMLKALLYALLEPGEMLRRLENEGNYTARLAYLEELKTLPFGAVWDEYCRRQDVPPGWRWLETVNTYEEKVLADRD